MFDNGGFDIPCFLHLPAPGICRRIFGTESVAQSRNGSDHGVAISQQGTA
jgi:hypothetical protein